MPHVSSADPCGDLKSAPTNTDAASCTGGLACSSGTQGEASVAGTSANAAVDADRASPALSDPRATNTPRASDESADLQETRAPANASLSLAAGHGLSEMRKASTGSPSETGAGRGGASAPGDTIMDKEIEYNTGGVLEVAVAVGDSVADRVCVCESDGEDEPD